MGSTDAKSIPADNAEGNGEAAPDEGGRVIGGWAKDEEIYLIDRAALEEGMKRGPWLVKVAIDRARTVLASKSVLEGSVTS